MRNKILMFLLIILTAFGMMAQVYGITNADEINERKIDPDKPMIALTFDDGPSDKYTPAILDVLKKHDSAATFFVLGTEVKKNKDLLIQMVEDGNEIGNHSYNHADLTKVSDYDLYRQLVGTDDLIRQNVGYTPKIMRPPYGFVNEEFNKKIHLPIILWSLDTLDWENRNTEIISRNILDNVKDGDIILMHDIYDSTARAVEIVVPELINRGYQLVTVSELYEYRNTALLSGNIYNKMNK